MPAVIEYPGSLSPPSQQLLQDGAKLSWLSYSEPDVVNAKWTAKDFGEDRFEVLRRVKRCPQFISCDECDAQCYIAEYDPPKVDTLQDRPVLAILARGTTSLMDWMCDARANQVDFKDCRQRSVGKVHAGFYRQFIGLFSIFDKQIKRHLEAGGNLLCVGHSLGSAIATIAAVNYGLGFPRQVWFAGYGTPRVLNKTLADAFEGVVQTRLRVKNASDPVVAIVPPISYVHVGTEMHLGPKDDYPDIPVILDVADHDIATYVAHLARPEASTEAKSPATRSWLQRALSRA